MIIICVGDMTLYNVEKRDRTNRIQGTIFLKKTPQHLFFSSPIGKSSEL